MTKAPAPILCTLLDLERADASAGAIDDALLDLAAIRLQAILHFRHEALKVEDIEARLLKGEKVIVLGTLPPRQSLAEKSPDSILSNPWISFLLSHPSCSVCFITSMTRSGIDLQLQSWVERADVPTTNEPVERRELASASPLFWSFVCISELMRDETDSSWADLREVSTLCAEFAIFDPTGLRTLIHSILGCFQNFQQGEIGKVQNPHDAVPLFAVVADDETDVVVVESYHLRRLGYSTFPVANRVAWRQTTSGSWRERIKSYDALVFDDYMEFEPGVPKIGHAMLDSLPATVKIYVTGIERSGPSIGARPIIHKPILDSSDLQHQLSVKHPTAVLWNFMNHRGSPKLSGRWKPMELARRFFRLVKSLRGSRTPYVASRGGFHPSPATELRATAESLFDLGVAMGAKGRCLDASLHYLEAYLLFRRHAGSATIHAGSAAMRAFQRFQALDIQQIAERHPEALHRSFWKGRQREIEESLRQTFGARTRERLWWAVSIFQQIEAIMKKTMVSNQLLSRIEDSASWAMLRFRWYEERHTGRWLGWFHRLHSIRWLRWLSWLNPWMWLKWAGHLLFISSNSFSRLAMFWLVFVGLFSAI